MEKTHDHAVTAQPRLHQTAPEIQAYGSVSHNLPLELEEPVRLEITERLNQLLADTITIRDCRTFASRASRLGDDGTNDLIVSQVLRSNELQTWFLSEHLVNVPLVNAERDGRKARTLP